MTLYNMLSEHKNLLATLIIGMFFISFISADLTFQQGKEVDLKIVCINAGFCSSSGQCNVSVFSPSENTLLDAIPGTQSPSLAFYNITIPSNSIQEFGDYRVSGFCKDGSVTAVVDFTFEVTGDGNPSQVFPKQFFFILLGFLMIVFGFVNERFSLMKTLGGIIWMVMGVITLFPGYSFINHTTLFGIAFGTILIGGGFYFLIEGSFGRNRTRNSFDQTPEEVFD